MSKQISLRVFTLDDSELAEAAFAIRKKVFVEEQNVSPEEEYDEFEESSRHFLLFADEVPVATARWRKTKDGIKLERFAVLPEFRNAGLGSAILNAVLEEVLPVGGKIYLHAQVPAMNLYKRAGFAAVGDLFYEAGIPHFKMVYQSA